MKSSASNLSPQEKRELLEKLLKDKAAKNAPVNETATLIQPVDRSTGTLPLSSAQNRILFLDEFEPGLAAYNIPAIVRLGGALDVQALEASLNEIVKRHEPLRTNYKIENGLAVQEIVPSTVLQLRITNLDSIPEADRGIEMKRLMLAEAGRPFQLVAI